MDSSSSRGTTTSASRRPPSSSTPTNTNVGQWKKRLGFGRKGKAIVLTSAAATAPPDDGDARRLKRLTKSGLFAFRSKAANQTKEQRDDDPYQQQQRRRRQAPHPMTNEDSFATVEEVG